MNRRNAYWGFRFSYVVYGIASATHIVAHPIIFRIHGSFLFLSLSLPLLLPLLSSSPSLVALRVFRRVVRPALLVPGDWTPGADECSRVFGLLRCLARFPACCFLFGLCFSVVCFVCVVFVLAFCLLVLFVQCTVFGRMPFQSLLHSLFFHPVSQFLGW